MLESLSQQIQEKVPSALESPIRGYHLYYYWSRLNEGLTNSPDFKEVEAEYEAASITFSYQEIFRLSGEEFLLLQQRLQLVITQAFINQGEIVPEEIASHLIPGSEKNVLVHEKEHLDVLPEALKREARIDVVLVQGDNFHRDIPRGQLGIDGLAVYDNRKATLYDFARSAAAPRYLSQTDKEDALRYARDTQDEAFIASIREKVGPVLQSG